jgi:hypothetical protein
MKTAEDVVRFVAEYCAKEAQKDVQAFYGGYPDVFTIDPDSLLSELIEASGVPLKKVNAWVKAASDAKHGSK